MIIADCFHYFIIVAKSFHFFIIIIKWLLLSIIITKLLNDLLSIRHFTKLYLEFYLHLLLLSFVYFSNFLIKFAIKLSINLVPLHLFFYLQISINKSN